MHQYPDAYINYLVEFHGTRDYFECHEIMEEYWKEQEDALFATTWLGLIQAAVSSYHHRRGNLAGAVKMLRSTLEHSEPERLVKLGIDAGSWISSLKERLQSLEQGESLFVDLNIPIQDMYLLDRCKQHCLERDVAWCEPSDMTDESLIHRHTLRDRSDVIAERQRQLEARHVDE
ncbi:hypothetical protein BVG16_23465 [Paenibacillus selenitireducens]|uniref:DUF309 domain-containing protein n=1 Tax=Paenibacillus selenitireducens TaxID=1324314 RepID=A0A1T2X4G9_9BACL|nr:DUF309 domain-containing protein [Paenibacillus selenitireducens]OPA74715.1 hypothetical protein BVG16_23465 [Paenibacillus selenitireducens]